MVTRLPPVKKTPPLRTGVRGASATGGRNHGTPRRNRTHIKPTRIRLPNPFGQRRKTWRKVLGSNQRTLSDDGLANRCIATLPTFQNWSGTSESNRCELLGRQSPARPASSRMLLFPVATGEPPFVLVLGDSPPSRHSTSYSTVRFPSFSPGVGVLLLPVSATAVSRSPICSCWIDRTQRTGHIVRMLSQQINPSGTQN